MRIVPVLSLMLARLTSSGLANAQVTDAARAEITDTENAWRKARIAGDTAFLERFYASEGRIQGMDGEVQSREADIALFATGKIKPKFIDHGPLEIATYGNTAGVTGVDHLGGRLRALWRNVPPIHGRSGRRGGRWQLVVQQATSTSGF